jgi:hypothetical protein
METEQQKAQYCCFYSLQPADNGGYWMGWDGGGEWKQVTEVWGNLTLNPDSPPLTT